MEFGRRMATERDLDKSDAFKFSNVGNVDFHLSFKLVESICAHVVSRRFSTS